MMTQPFGVQAVEGGFRVIGELDVSTAPKLADAVRDGHHNGSTLTLDLSQLSFIDSTGISCFITIARNLGATGKLVLDSPQNLVTRVLTLTGIDSVPGIEIRRRQ